MLTTSLVFAGGTTTNKRRARAEKPVDIKIVPVGMSPEELDKLKERTERSATVQNELNGASYRLISFGYLETNDKATSGIFAPQRFRIIFYDYTNERTLVAEGDLSQPEDVRVFEDASKPDASVEEFDYAVQILQQNSEFGTALKSNTLKTFQAMPPITVSEDNNERLINVGLSSLDNSTANEVVSVSLKNEKVIRYPSHAPPTSMATPTACGVPDSGQSTTGSGTAGQYQMTVSQNGTTLWEMLVIRPSASSGSRKSGIELRDLKYRGKMVLKRAHSPILNVQYMGGQCGPYRDWQYQEDMFQTAAGSTDPAPGIRILPPGSVAKTVLESGTDTGDFRGVAVYTQDNETVLVTEMQAGWYRYLMEWRLANDGTIRPRYGFGATDDSCVCFVHNHHVYWRFDFDIVNANNNVFIAERGRKFLTPVTTEAAISRSYQTNRSIVVQNATGDEAYMLVPNLTDGVADTFGKGDFWLLKYKNVVGGTSFQNEIDDGVNCTTCSTAYIQIAQFLNGESLVNQDSVVWYGAHFIHSDGASLSDPDGNGKFFLSGSHVVGPDIRPIRW
ncbi:MAG: hypothetical protein ABI954_11545 [Pyrinomonadaceae bacterium]